MDEATQPESEATPPEGQAPGSAPLPEDQELQARVVEVLREIYDPEIPVDIYELGLIYSVNVDAELGRVHIEMTLTSPACPVAGTLPGEVETRAGEVEGVDQAQVELVWEPPWNMDRLSDAAKLQMGLT